MQIITLFYLLFAILALPQSKASSNAAKSILQFKRKAQDEPAVCTLDLNAAADEMKKKIRKMQDEDSGEEEPEEAVNEDLLLNSIDKIALDESCKQVLLNES